MKLLFLLILIVSILLLSEASQSINSASKNPSPEGVNQYKNAPKVKKDHPENQTERIAPTELEKSLIETLRAIASQQRTAEDQNRTDQQPWWKDYGLLTVTVVYTVFAGLQWWTIRRQASITAQSAEAAKQSADVAEKSLSSVERAWLAVVFDQPFQPQVKAVTPICFTVKNTGNTVALLKLQKINAKRWEFSCIPGRQLEPKPMGILPTIAVIFPGDKLTLDGLVDIPFTQDDIDSADSQPLLFDVYGHITYDDVFGIRHITRFCQVYNSRTDGFDFPREAQPDYNDAD